MKNFACWTIIKYPKTCFKIIAASTVLLLFKFYLQEFYPQY
jgi:hypothetical protein